MELETRTELQLLSFDEWVDFKLEALTPAQKDKLAYRWLVAIVESFAQKRLKLAPIDEPCDAWIKDWISLLN